MRQVVLDIDLDFFVTPIHRSADTDNDPRLSDSQFAVDEAERAVRFMTHGLGLNPERPLPGAVVNHHKEVFELWEDLIQKGRLLPKFSVIHVDAHDDIFGWEKEPRLKSDNYLIHAVRREWLAHICFLQPDGSHEFPLVYMARDEKSLKFDGHEVGISVLNKSEAAFATAKQSLKPNFLFLAKSPAFTPPSADALIPVILKFMCPL